MPPEPLPNDHAASGTGGDEVLKDATVKDEIIVVDPISMPAVDVIRDSVRL